MNLTATGKARFDLNGAAALVTGAARGIGFATAQELHRRGASVCVVDLQQDAAEEAARAIGKRAYGAGCDVTDRRAIELVVNEAIERFDKLDLVVANAGIGPPVSTIASVNRDAFDRVIAVNQEGVVNTVFPALGQVIENRGHVLVIASIYAYTNGALAASYAMSKAAVEQFGQALRVELAPHGASAGVGYFGFVDTAMVADAYEDPIVQQMDGRIPKPLRKKISPDQAGKALVDGIAGRAARTIRPRRWIALSVLRGIVNPIVVVAAARDQTIAGLVRGIDTVDDD